MGIDRRLFVACQCRLPPLWGRSYGSFLSSALVSVGASSAMCLVHGLRRRVSRISEEILPPRSR